ncbi:hydrolases or acyltransferases (alpha/beta hydrolase superfamily) [Legionella beliardensis]|uniref:Hydrolases or acyltransferases (Alpha/beta hydrolase superfamily) n=1 Tax=Legionella beliardensis TaxID=91822 RepID=A0A378HYK8_9GAMM|nr:alpha/beta hydrolase [Legionella beliardensis]STX27987.1 hydrolases or acyltransferases (alpha/beta hydrolase superfamily) [Legionella beliardensis]
MSNQLNYFYDENQVRFNLLSTRGKESINWLFFPGGPGVDSSYLFDLVNLLNLPGNVWLIDLPGNGSHGVNYENFDKWLDIFLPTVQKFANPVLVGHSFGGMLPLLYPELETILAGLVILNSAPGLWLEAAVKKANELNLPDLSLEMQTFTENPTQETFNQALAACMPYYFPKESLVIGQEKLLNVPINFMSAVWWQRKAFATNFNAKWIPNSVPTLIVSAEFDAICPAALFMEDKRFERLNISKHYIEKAGHLPWLEKPNEINHLFENFLANLHLSQL